MEILVFFTLVLSAITVVKTANKLLYSLLLDLDSVIISAWFDTLLAINRKDIAAQVQEQDTATLANVIMRVDYAAIKKEINSCSSSRNIGI